MNAVVSCCHQSIKTTINKSFLPISSFGLDKNILVKSFSRNFSWNHFHGKHKVAKKSKIRKSHFGICGFFAGTFRWIQTLKLGRHFCGSLKIKIYVVLDVWFWDIYYIASKLQILGDKSIFQILWKSRCNILLLFQLI